MCGLSRFIFRSSSARLHVRHVPKDKKFYGNLRLIFNDFAARFDFGVFMHQVDRIPRHWNCCSMWKCFLFEYAFIFFQLEDFKIAQKEQERQIEKEISNRERDINCLKHFRSRCADIVRQTFKPCERFLTIRQFPGIRIP